MVVEHGSLNTYESDSSGLDVSDTHIVLTTGV